MELEVPDEAESAEGGTVTSEATWSTESGAVAGNGSGPRVSMCTPSGPACRPRRGPVDPSECRRGAETRGRETGTFHSGVRGVMERPPTGPGDLPWARGRWNAPPGGLGVASPVPGIPCRGTRAGGGIGCRAPF